MRCVATAPHNSSEQLGRLTVVELNRGRNTRSEAQTGSKASKKNCEAKPWKLNLGRNVVRRKYELHGVDEAVRGQLLVGVVELDPSIRIGPDSALYNYTRHCIGFVLILSMAKRLICHLRSCENVLQYYLHQYYSTKRLHLLA